MREGEGQAVQAFRGSIVHFRRDPGIDGDVPEAYEYHDDGLLVVERARVARVGPAGALGPALPPPACR